MSYSPPNNDSADFELESGYTAPGNDAADFEFVSAPSAPSNLTASATADDITLDWDAANWNGDQGHYDVYRGTSSGSYSQIAQVSAGTTSYTDIGLLDGERYYYVVDATNSGGTSGDSNEAAATTALPAPSNITVS